MGSALSRTVKAMAVGRTVFDTGRLVSATIREGIVTGGRDLGPARIARRAPLR